MHYGDDNSAQRELSGSAQFFDKYEDASQKRKTALCSQCHMPMDGGDTCRHCGFVDEHAMQQYDEVLSMGAYDVNSVREAKIRGPIREHQSQEGSSANVPDMVKREQEERERLERILLNDTEARKMRDGQVADRRRSLATSITNDAERETFFEKYVVRVKNRQRGHGDDSDDSDGDDSDNDTVNSMHPPSMQMMNEEDWYSFASQQSYGTSLLKKRGMDAYETSVDSTMKLIRELERTKVPESVRDRLRWRVEKESDYGDPLPSRDFKWLNNDDIFYKLDLWKEAANLGIDIDSRNIVDILISHRVLSFLYCYQTVLMVMAQDLVDRMHFPPVTVQIMQQLWQRYVNQFDPVAASGIWTFQMRDASRFNELIPHAEDTLAFCYLAAMLSGKPIVLGNILHWAQSGQLAYRNICPMLIQNVPLWKACARRCMCFSNFESSQNIIARHANGYMKSFLMPVELRYNYIMELSPLPQFDVLWNRVSALHTILYPERVQGRIMDSDGLSRKLCHDVLCLPSCNLRESIVSLVLGLMHAAEKESQSTALPLITFDEYLPPEALVAVAIILVLQLFLRLDMETQDSKRRALWVEIATRMTSAFHYQRMERGDVISEIYRPSHGLNKYADMDRLHAKDVENLRKEFTHASINAVGYKGNVLSSFTDALLDGSSPPEDDGAGQATDPYSSNHQQPKGNRWWLGSNRQPKPQDPIVSKQHGSTLSQRIVRHGHDLRTFEQQEDLLFKVETELYNLSELGDDLLAVDLRDIQEADDVPILESRWLQTPKRHEMLPAQLGFLVDGMAQYTRIPLVEISGYLSLFMHRVLATPKCLIKQNLSLSFPETRQ